MNSTDMSWAAGIVEGEGCISLYKESGWALRVNVTNTDLTMLEQLKTLFGGNICKTANYSPTKHRTRWQWDAKNRIGASVIAAILPYMRTRKKTQAAIALASRELVAIRGSNINHNTRMLQAMERRLKELKHE